MSRDLRQYARQTNVRLFIGFLILLFIIGDGLIYYFYGFESALFGLMCMAVGITPLILIAVVLWGMETIVQRVNDD